MTTVAADSPIFRIVESFNFTITKTYNTQYAIKPDEMIITAVIFFEWFVI